MMTMQVIADHPHHDDHADHKDGHEQRTKEELVHGVLLLVA